MGGTAKLVDRRSIVGYNKIQGVLQRDQIEGNGFQVGLDNRSRRCNVWAAGSIVSNQDFIITINIQTRYSSMDRTSSS